MLLVSSVGVVAGLNTGHRAPMKAVERRMSAEGSTRLLSISDLHIGGARNAPMLGHPDLLVAFLDQVTSLASTSVDPVELVINGDFIDFLAEPPFRAWTPSESEARDKLDAVLRDWKPIVEALARCAASRCKVTFLIGNHDLELAYPAVRDRLFTALGTSPHACHFIFGSEAYRRGDVLLEHGNRYDVWNAIDHDRLRQVASAASRGEDPLDELRVCPGAKLVHDVIHPLRSRYPFVELLKPEDKIVVLLLTALEPSLLADLPRLFSFASRYAEQAVRWVRRRAGGRGEQPAQPELVSAGAGDLPTKIAAAFDAELDLPQQELVSTDGALRKAFLQVRPNSLAEMLTRGEEVDPKRLRKLQLALAAKLEGDRSFDDSDEDNGYARAASAIVARGAAKIVVMGHTHLARSVRVGSGHYVNTGTWADLIRIDPALLDETALLAPAGLSERSPSAGGDRHASGPFVAWLTKLIANDPSLRAPAPAFADVTIDRDGHVIERARPFLRRFAKNARLA